ncbi:MAG: hypothetical protein OXE99_02580 [Cellvibrionales bacterium]|nr:hypothetical protein [Cellvibrionales bacterium]
MNIKFFLLFLFISFSCCCRSEGHQGTTDKLDKEKGSFAIFHNDKMLGVIYQSVDPTDLQKFYCIDKDSMPKMNYHVGIYLDGWEKLRPSTFDQIVDLYEKKNGIKTHNIDSNELCKNLSEADRDKLTKWKTFSDNQLSPKPKLPAYIAVGAMTALLLGGIGVLGYLEYRLYKKKNLI